MRTFDLAPLYRATVGFEQIADLMDRLLSQPASDLNYPPYNIEKTGDAAWRISIAVAGFSADELAVELRENALIVTARKAEDDSDRKFLHRGIAGRAFERRFVLADHIEVVGAELQHGLLHVALERRVPEALKPRRIPISAGSQPRVIEAEAQAA